MKKKFITSSFLLLVGGVLTKLLGMVIKIVISNRIGLEGLSLYMLVLPTFSLLMTVAQAGVPLALSKLVSTHDVKPHTLYFTVILSLTVYNIILSIIVLLSARFISSNLLHQSNLYLPILAISFVIPFTTLSSIIRSYFVGTLNMAPPVLSNLVENIIRFIFVYFFLVYFKNYSTSFIVFIIIIFNIISEGVSCLFLLLFLPKRKRNYSFDTTCLKDTLKLSIPNLLSSFIGSFTYFLEPIILLYFSNSSSINVQYGILTGYVFPILLLPTFFVNAISQALIPVLTNNIKNKSVTKLLRFIIINLVLFSIVCSISFIIFGDRLLLFIYHTKYGFNYLRILSIFLFFLYLQPICSTIFLSLGKTKYIFYTTLFSSFIRVFTMIIFLILNLEIYSLIYSFIINVSFTCLFQIYLIKKEGIILF